MTATADTETKMRAPTPRSKRGSAPAEASTTEEFTPTVAVLLARVKELEAELEKWPAKWERAWQEMGQQADARGLCSEYDEVVKRIGGIPRYQNCTVAMTVTARTAFNDAHLRRALGMAEYEVVTLPSEGLTVEWSAPLNMSERMKVEAGHCACQSADMVRFANDWLRGRRLLRATTVLSVQATGCDVARCRTRNP